MINPLIPAEVKNGKYPNGLYDQYFYTENYVNKYKTYRAIASAFAEIEPVKNLVYTARVGTDAYVKFMDRYLKPSSQISSTGMVQKSTYYAAKTTVNNTLEYKMFFNDNKDDLSILLGHEFLNYGYKDQIAFGSGLTDDRYLTLDNTLASSRDVKQSKSQYRFLSFFAHADYSHADKYFLDFTIRNDEEKKIKPGESDGYAYYEEDGTYRGTIFIFNTSDKDIVPEKGIVGGLTLNPGSPVKKNDLKLAGDLGFESQPDDFGQVLGYQLTNYVSMSNYTSYEWYFEDEGYYTSLQAQYGEDGKLSTVWLMNNADLRK